MCEPETTKAGRKTARPHATQNTDTKMPVKAHVKGKRKAPPPPIALDARRSTEKLAINLCESTFPNRKTGNTPETMTCVTIQKRKKPAPMPPTTTITTPTITSTPRNGKLQHTARINTEKRAIDDEMNNLSAITKRVNDKSPVKAINLNIFEPNHIRNDLQCTTIKETNEVNVNLDVNGKQDLFDMEFRSPYQRNDQMWICNYCTLQNPFWKIICDACERIKPYNTPTLMASNANRPFVTNAIGNDSTRINEKNLIGSVMMRPKPLLKPNHDGDKILNRNSMMVDIKSASSSKQMPNKRNSLCLIKYGDQNITPEALEMEKERIRAVIRAMHNRALSQKYPAKGDKLNELAKSNEIPTKTATINKPGKRNGFSKYEIEKDYNLPSIRRNASPTSTLSSSSTTKPTEIEPNWMPNRIKPIRKIENVDNIVKCNELVGEIQTYCDQQSSLANTRTNLELNAKENEKKRQPSEQKHRTPIPITSTLTKNSIKSGIDNGISLNLYINFSNAIEVKARRDMTLEQFKIHIFDKLIPCTNPKIYFNGLLLRNDDQSLAKYGIINQSSLYINTENIVVQANVKNEKKSVIVQTEEPSPSKIVPKADEIKETKRDEKVQSDTTTSKSLFDDAVKKNADGEKFLIEHVQLNRYTIERVPPNTNICKVKYRGVYNYNPRCNPDISKILNNKPVNAMVKKPLTVATAKTSQKTVTESLNPISEVAQNAKPITQYIELLSLDDSMDLTKNPETFECSVCFVEYQPYEGVILRNCLHTFCKDCVRNTITYSDEAEVKCPFMDEKYSCDCLLQDREIKALLSKTEYDEHLAKSLRIAENQIVNSFHCKTPDCKGWCIYEDDVNTFKCPICQLENCLTCRVIHDGLDCKQYQSMMKNNVENNPENATTHAMLEEMIKSGEAMNCPACKIVLMKKWGCDWLKCSMCKTEICWITRGYRWGPAGKGDTSAGCKCGVDGFKCHPKCNYCH